VIAVVVVFLANRQVMLKDFADMPAAPPGNGSVSAGKEAQ
jgi:hypothetical protein